MRRSASAGLPKRGGAGAAARALALVAVLTGALSGCGEGSPRPAGHLPPSSAVATVAATPAGAARALPRDWLGFNGEAVTAPLGLWSTPGFVAAVAALHPEAIRLFGGTTANFWNWRTGTFVDASAARRVTLPPELAAARAHVSIPLRAWAQIVRSAGAVPVYDLNLVSSSLAQQLAMLRAARALGLPVTRVELGNELYLRRYRRLFASGAAYGRVATRWARAVKAAFPGVRVAAAAFVPRSLGAAVNARERAWNGGLAATLRDADAVAIHPYFQSGLAAAADVATAGAAAAMLRRPSLRWAAVQSGTLAQLPPGLRVWATEYNLFDRVAPVHTTWAQGLALGGYTLDLLADARVEQADVHALVSSAPFGALFADPNGLAFGDRARLSFRAPVAHPPATRPLDLSATGVATAALLEALAGASRAQPLRFAVVAPAGMARAAVAALRGALLWSSSGRPRGIIVNQSPFALIVRPPAALARARFEERWAGPATIVSGAAALRRVRGLVDRGGVVVPGYSVTVLSL